MIGRNDPCFCGSGKKWKQCHYPQKDAQSMQDELALRYRRQYGIILKNSLAIEGIRQASHLAAFILKSVCAMAKEGVTTAALDAYAHSLHIQAGARPAPLGYGQPPFPKSICTSLNDVICHGIPNEIPLKEGDLISIDVSCEYKGYYGDCCATVLIGDVSDEKHLVSEVSKESLHRAIQILKPGCLVSDIGAVIEDYAIQHGCSSVIQCVGHGIGISFREPPQIPHFHNNLQIPLVAGMTFTIEPMINAGRAEGYIDEHDGWTMRTIDGKPSAQWEHQILITDDGYEILTISE